MQGKIEAAAKEYDTLETQMFDNQDRKDSIETFVNLKHPAGGGTSRRASADRSKRELAIEDVVESGRVAITALERKIDALHQDASNEG